MSVKEAFEKAFDEAGVDYIMTHYDGALWAARWMADYLSNYSEDLGENASWIRRLSKELSQ